jgi:ribonuclease HII
MPRQNPDLSLEIPLWQGGISRLAGVDEAGRGAWAGPVAAAAVILPADEQILQTLKGVRDSKQMTPLQRSRWAGQIRQMAVAWGVGMASNQEIDALGIVPATRLAMQRALQALKIPPQHLLIDALRLPEIEVPQTSLPHGDAVSLSIAAASVLAKTARDAVMVEFDHQFPGYSFARHKGYGTAAHSAALQRLGACPLHRFSFAPLKQRSSVKMF